MSPPFCACFFFVCVEGGDSSVPSYFVLNEKQDVSHTVRTQSREKQGAADRTARLSASVGHPEKSQSPGAAWPANSTWTVYQVQLNRVAQPHSCSVSHTSLSEQPVTPQVHALLQTLNHHHGTNVMDEL